MAKQNVSGQDLVAQDLACLARHAELPAPSHGLPKGFKADGVKDPVRLIGHITDMKLGEPSMPNVWLTSGEIFGSMQFYFHQGRIMVTKAEDLLPSIEIRTSSSEDQCGDFRRTSDDVLVMAFIHKWALLCEDEEKNKELLTRMRTGAKHVRYRLIRGVGVDPFDNFFQAYQEGENVIRKALDSGNQITFRRMERYEQLRSLLKSQGEDYSTKAMLARFQAKEKAGIITYATKDTQIKSVEVISKLLALQTSAKNAGFMSS